jgi:hypothetical protein
MRDGGCYESVQDPHNDPTAFDLFELVHSEQETLRYGKDAQRNIWS